MSLRLGFLLCVGVTSALGRQPDEQFTLICRYGNQFLGNRERNLQVDVTNQTLDSRPATISEGQIAQTQEDDDFAVQITINRHTGAFRLTSVAKKDKRNLPDIVGICDQLQAEADHARFLGAAQIFKARLVTEDARLRQAAPPLTISLSDTLAASQRL